MQAERWLAVQASNASRYPRASQDSQTLEAEENRTPPSVRRNVAAMRASGYDVFPEASPGRSERAFRAGEGWQRPAGAWGGAASRRTHSRAPPAVSRHQQRAQLSWQFGTAPLRPVPSLQGQLHSGLALCSNKAPCKGVGS